MQAWGRKFDLSQMGSSLENFSKFVFYGTEKVHPSLSSSIGVVKTSTASKVGTSRQSAAARVLMIKAQPQWLKCFIQVAHQTYDFVVKKILRILTWMA